MPAITRYPTPDIAVASTAIVGEGPVWDHRSGSLCWIDLDAGLLMQESLEAKEQVVASLGTMLGAVAPRVNAEGFAVAVREGFGLWHEERLTLVDNPFMGLDSRRMSDAKCDSRGRLWAGSTHVDYQPGAGALHCWDGSSPSTAVRTGMTLPNGIGWSPNNDVMYLVETMEGLLLSSRFDADDGVTLGFEPLCSIEGGLPDGLAVDTDGCIWVAIWGAGEVRRFDPAGRHIGAVPVPATLTSSCAFGPDGTLYITSATRDLTESERQAEPHAGSVFALVTSVGGTPIAEFRG